MTSISVGLKEFLDQAPRRPVDATVWTDATRAIIELLEAYFDSYGHLRLDEEEGEISIKCKIRRDASDHVR